MFSADVARWGEEHFSSALLSDRRRIERLVTVATAFASLPGESIPRVFGRPYDVKATYRFLRHPEVTPDNIQAGHRLVVLEGMHEPGTYLLVGDGSDMSWSGHEPIEGLGPIGTGAKGLQGFLLHSVLAVKWPHGYGLQPSERRPPLEILGLADQQYYVRPPKLGRARDRTQDSETLETHLWEQSSARLGSAPKGVRWVRVCDSGADIYEFLLSCQAHGHGFVVRACKDRVLLNETGRADGKLFASLRTLEQVGQFELFLRARPGQASRTAKLAIGFRPVCLRSPQRPGHGPGKLASISCFAIRVWELDAPEGVEPLEWMLLTDAEVGNFTEARECVIQYASRWIIEEFHKALKTGMGAERLQLESAHALFAAVAIKSIAALRLIDLRERARIQSDAPAEESGLDPLELKLLAVRLDRDIRTVRDVVLAIGRMGGHMNRKADGLPGWKTLWLGWQELQTLAEGARLALQMSRFG